MNEQTSDRKVILAGILVTELRPVISARTALTVLLQQEEGSPPS